MAEITKDNLRDVDIKNLALNKDKFGALTFDNSYRQLENLQKLFADFDDYDYKGNLTQEEINNIENYKGTLAGYLTRLAAFNPGEDSSFNKDVRDNFENEVKNNYESIIRSLRNVHVYLRQEADLKSRGNKDISKQITATKKEAESIVLEMKKELDQLKAKKTDYEVAHGQEAAEKFSSYFSSQADIYKKESEQWLQIRKWFFIAMFVVIAVNIVIYLYLLFFGGSIGMSVEKFFTWQYGAAKLVLLSLLSYGVGFASKNYHIYAQLESVNVHRTNAANTMNDLIVANPDKEDVRGEVIRQAADAMFKHLPVGHITRSENSLGPISEVVNKFIGK